MSGYSGGLIPAGNGGFISPTTGTFIPAAQAASLMGSQVANPGGNSSSAPFPVPYSTPPPYGAAATLAPASSQGALSLPPSFGAAPTPPAQQAPTPQPAAASSGGLSGSTQALLASLRAKQVAASATASAASSSMASPGASTPTSPTMPQGMGWLDNLESFESGGDPNAANPNSSARGTFQFTSGTFGDFLNSPVAKVKGYTAKDITNPAASQVAAQWYAGQNATTLAAAGFPNASPGDLVAAHVLGPRDTIAIKKAAVANPNTPMAAVIGAADPNAKAVFMGNAGFVNPSDTVSQFLAKASAVATGAYKSTGGAGVQLASNGASDVPLTSGTQGTAGTGDPGVAPGGFMGTYQQMMGALPKPMTLPQAPQFQGAPPLLGMTPSLSNQALAFAGGLLSGHSLGDGLGKADTNLVNLRQQQTELANDARLQTTALDNSAAQTNFANKLGVAITGNDAALNRANTALQLAQLMRPKPLGYMPVQTGTGAGGKPTYAMPMQDAAGNVIMDPLGSGVTPGQVALANQRSANQFDNETQLNSQRAGLSEGNKQTNDNYKQSVSDLANYRQISNSAIEQAQNANNVLGLLGPNGSAVGPTAASQATRWLAKTFGISPSGVTADGLGLTQQGADELKTNILPTLKTMGITRIAGPELNFLGSVVPNHDISLQALQAMASEIRDESQMRISNIKAWDALPPDQQAQIMASPSGAGGWFSSRTRQAYGVNGATANPGSSISPSGSYTGTAGYNARGNPTYTPSSTAQDQQDAPSLPHVASAADFAALPSGAQFIDPQGNIRKKP